MAYKLAMGEGRYWRRGGWCDHCDGYTDTCAKYVDFLLDVWLCEVCAGADDRAVDSTTNHGTDHGNLAGGEA